MTQVADPTTATGTLDSIVEEPVVVKDHARAQTAVNAALDVLASLGQSNLLKPRYGNHEITHRFTVPHRGGVIHVMLAVNYKGAELNVSVHATNATGHSFSLEEPAYSLHCINADRGHLAPYKGLKLEGGGAFMSWTQARLHS